MRARPLLIVLTAFALAAGLAVLAATWIAGAVERRTAEQVRAQMLLDGLDWVAVRADGLEVHLTGLAPSEAQRFRALNAAGRIVDSDRLRDGIDVTPAAAILPPRFSVELLRNDEGISLIGLVPAEMGRAALALRVGDLAGGARVTDMLEEAAFPAPAGWSAAMDFGLTAAGMLPRSKISIAADRVAVTAIAASAAEKRRLEADLTRARPPGLQVVLDISAPRPVLTPFTFRAVREADGLRLEACSADTEAARDRILAAARAAGLTGEAACTVGLGVPTPRWAEGVAAGLRALAVLPEASLTFSDADVTLLAGAGVPQAVFDRAVGELQADLPDVFSLKATLEPRPQQAAADEPAEFTATLSPEGRIELRGRLTDEAQRQAVASFARARFGSGAVYVATRLDPDLPDGWPVRVLAGLEAMARLAQGSLVVRPDTVQLRGTTGLPDAQAEIARILSDQLGQGQGFSVQVTYDKALDPTAALPTPAECVAALNGILARGKIVFAPGSAEIDATAGATMQALADQLRKCPDVAMEIGGHTDSQGSEEGNLALSQARAEAVLIGLQGRRVPVAALTARGYGEGRPIADNASEEGREANRRIEFTLLTDPAAADPAAADPAAAPAEAAAPATDPDLAEARPAPRPEALERTPTGGDAPAPAPAGAADQAIPDLLPPAPPPDALPGQVGSGDGEPGPVPGPAADPGAAAARAADAGAPDRTAADAAPAEAPPAEAAPADGGTVDGAPAGGGTVDGAPAAESPAVAADGAPVDGAPAADPVAAADPVPADPAPGADPATPDPATPDPVTPDPVTPDPATYESSAPQEPTRRPEPRPENR